MNRISASGLLLLLVASLVLMPSQAMALGSGIAASTCDATIGLASAADTTCFGPVLASASGSVPAAAIGSAARPEGMERSGQSDAIVQQAQWIRRIDMPVAEPGILVLLVAGFLGIWAVARRRNLSS